VERPIADHFGFWIADFGLGISIQNPKSKIQNRPISIQNPKSKIENRKSPDFNPKSKIQNPKSKIQNRPVAPWPQSVAEANSPQVFNALAGSNLEIGLAVDFDRGEPVIADLIQHPADGSEVDVAGPKGSAVAFAQMHVT